MIARISLLPLLATALITSASAGLDTSKLAKMDSAIERAIARKKCPGGVLWFEHRGESYTKHFGRRAVEPTEEAMTADTVFDAASLTKVIATTTPKDSSAPKSTSVT